MNGYEFSLEDSIYDGVKRADTTWTTQDGRELEPAQMHLSHLENALNMLMRNASRKFESRCTTLCIVALSVVEIDRALSIQLQQKAYEYYRKSRDVQFLRHWIFRRWPVTPLMEAEVKNRRGIYS